MKIRNFSKAIFVSFLLLTFTFATFAQTMMKMPDGVKKITSVEGITEYQLDNGLKVLLFPDNTKQTITVNMTYLLTLRGEI